MSESETRDTVIPTREMVSIPHMNAIGYVIAGGIALVLLPILPLLLVLYFLGKRFTPSPGPTYQREGTGDAH